MTTPFFRLRVCFGKRGRLRFLSHLEVTRACERAARRARMPYAVTKGFTPRMRIAFGPALPVGTAGLREYYDLWLADYAPAAEVLERLRDKTPADLAPSAAGYVLEDEPSLSAALTIAAHEVVVRSGVGADKVSEALEAVTRSGELIVERKGKSKVFDLSEALPKEVQVSSHEDGARVALTTRIGPAGSLRPDALIAQALDRIGTPPQAVVVTRTDLLYEEGSDWRRPLG